jgi:uncharacterized glyoxalase superfamily protein PhnB
MVKLPEGAQQIAPYLLYEDATRAVDWLGEAFGFEERMRMTNEAGAVAHAEMALGDGMFLLGAPGGGYESPARSGQRHSQVYVYVDDVDAHCARARAHGAEVIEEPADQPYGERRYGALDVEGHAWYFATPL